MNVILRLEGTSKMTKKRPSRYSQHDNGTPREHENRVADRLGGKRVRGSGASVYSKGDVRDVELVAEQESVEFLTECKTTEKGSISVKWDWLTKITKEAVEVGKEPALAIAIRGGRECFLTDKDWVMVPARVLERLVSEK